MSIYLFPYMAQNIAFNAANITRSLAMHKFLLNSLKETRMFIPEYKYVNKILLLDDICEGKGIYGNNGLLEKLNNYEGHNIEQIDRLKYLDRLNSNLNSLINVNIEDEEIHANMRYKDLLHKEKIRDLMDINEKYIEKIKNQEYERNILKCIEVTDEDISLDYEWLKSINMKKTSLINIVKLFKEITDIGLIIDKKCFEENYYEDDSAKDINPLHYFVFNKNGELRYFIGFNTILKNQKYLNTETNKLYLTQNNMICFLSFMRIIKNTFHIRHIDTSLFINKIVDKIVNNSANLITFQDILNIIENDKEDIAKNKKSKIGVFLDTANIYTGIKDLEIDFDYLLMCIYGDDALKLSELRKATIVYEKNRYGKLKHNKYNKKNNKIQKHLEDKYGFDIKVLYKNTTYSNQIDDKALIDMIIKNMHCIDKVLLMTGDKDFKEIIDLCEKEGKEIQIISVCEGDTDKTKIVKHRNHSYIYKYWDCIRLYRG